LRVPVVTGGLAGGRVDGRAVDGVGRAELAVADGLAVELGLAVAGPD